MADEDAIGFDEDGAENAGGGDDEKKAVEAVYDVPVEMTAVLGTATMKVSQLLKLGRGAVVELNQRVDEEIELRANDRLIARGDVVVVDEHLGVTMTEIIKTNISKT
jgi:flagellar motor switch protein FliN/FliY